MRQITFIPTFAGWQKAARRALAEGTPPEEIAWEELGSGQPGLALFDEDESPPASKQQHFRVPKGFVELAQRVACHRNPMRWPLLYRALWRLTHGEPKLLEIMVDVDVVALMRMDKAVRHDVHKMRAFVRFRTVTFEDETWYVAWFEPEHHIVERNSSFFVDRFASMRWSILTPDRCAHWDGKHLSFTEGVPKSEAPTEGAVEDLWRTYYGSIFNPARVKTKAMLSEMPKRYWKNLPEAAVIPALLEKAPSRVSEMVAASKSKGTKDTDYSVAEPPDTEDWDILREAACACRACPLWQYATQTVFGEGPRPASIMLIGEQPGDSEDLAGHPFIGPAGQLLNDALIEAGIDRSQVYVTNAVKHFKWEPRGKRRLHQKPGSREVTACRPWLEAELRIVRPKMLVCLGATAAGAVLGPGIRILSDRGEIRDSQFGVQAVITFHPSALLRAPDPDTREQQYRHFVHDLRLAARG